MAQIQIFETTRCYTYFLAPVPCICRQLFEKVPTREIGPVRACLSVRGKYRRRFENYRKYFSNMYQYRNNVNILT